MRAMPACSQQPLAQTSRQQWSGFCSKTQQRRQRQGTAEQASTQAAVALFVCLSLEPCVKQLAALAQVTRVGREERKNIEIS